MELNLEPLFRLIVQLVCVSFTVPSFFVSHLPLLCALNRSYFFFLFLLVYSNSDSLLIPYFSIFAYLVSLDFFVKRKAKSQTYRTQTNCLSHNNISSREIQHQS
jgi:hypothetical protein